MFEIITICIIVSFVVGYIVGASIYGANFLNKEK